MMAQFSLKKKSCVSVEILQFKAHSLLLVKFVLVTLLTVYDLSPSSLTVT